jgi:hypothetical protein
MSRDIRVLCCEFRHYPRNQIRGTFSVSFGIPPPVRNTDFRAFKGQPLRSKSSAISFESGILGGFQRVDNCLALFATTKVGGIANHTREAEMTSNRRCLPSSICRRSRYNVLPFRSVYPVAQKTS